MCIYIYTYIRICVCVHVCVCVWIIAPNKRQKDGRCQAFRLLGIGIGCVGDIKGSYCCVSSTL